MFKVYTVVWLFISFVDFRIIEAIDDDTLFFDKTTPELETQLTEGDFNRAKLIRRQKLFSGSPKKNSRKWENFYDDSVMYRKTRFEGDITGSTQLNIRQGKAYTGVTNPNRTWKSRIIPYTISSQYTDYARSQIATAVDEYNLRTCLRFQPRTTEHDYIFIAPDDGCYSMVGRAGGKQTVSLGSGCLKKGVIIHELMHAVGFFHEQSRADRDDHVDVLWHNIDEDMVDQFQKYNQHTLRNLGIVYDYGSVMHYSSRAFSKNGEPTIVPKQHGAQIGQREGFSDLDVVKINKLYGCEAPPIFISTSTTRATFESYVYTPAPLPPQQPLNGINTFPVQLCRDIRDDCVFLKNVDYCRVYSDWMRTNCAQSCNMCQYGTSTSFAVAATNPCVDENNFCPAWARAGFCENGLPLKDYMQRKCKKSCSLCSKQRQ